jgi:ABC-type multidrug transport system ATPase subunit
VLIETQDAGKRYGKKWAIRGVSCTMEPGSVGAMIGPNGAGKTTWMRMLAGIIMPTKGTVLFDGEPFDRRNVDFRRRFFFLPDMLPAFGQHTPLRHASMVLNLYGRDAESLEGDLMDVYERFDLLDCLESPLAKLSRGQIYKTVLTPILVIRPELWLIDEPFAAGMDPEGMMIFRKLARAAATQGSTVLFTTQILEIAEDFADIIHVLHDGHLARSATPAELAAESARGDASEGLLQLLQRLRTEGSS